MLLPHFCALAHFALCANAGLTPSTLPESEHTAGELADESFSRHDFERHASILQDILGVKETGIFGTAPASCEKPSSSFKGHGVKIAEILPTRSAGKESSSSAAHGLNGPNTQCNDDELEFGAREVIVKAGAFIGGPDLAGARKLFGPISDILELDGKSKYSISTLPKAIAVYTLELLHIYQKLEAFLINTFADANSEWVSTMRSTATVIKSEAPMTSLTSNTRYILSHLIDSTNKVFSNIRNLAYVRKAEKISKKEHADKFKALINDDISFYQSFLRRLSKSNGSGAYCKTVGVVMAAYLSNNIAADNIDAQMKRLTDDEELLKSEIKRTIFDNVTFSRLLSHEHAWMTDFSAVIRPGALESAAHELIVGSTGVLRRSGFMRGMAVRKLEVQRRKLVLKLHSTILNSRAEVALTLLDSLSSRISNEIFQRTKLFVSELLSSAEITRALDDEERAIVTVVDKITGKKHRKFQVVSTNAPASAHWDEGRKVECLHRLDISIAAANALGVVPNGQIDEAVSTLENALNRFKRLLTERLELSKSMRELMRNFDDRKLMSTQGKRYKAVRIEIDAVKDSIGDNVKAIFNHVSRQSEYEAALESKGATLSVLVPLRAEIAQAETIEAVNRVFVKSAHDANEQENIARNQASHQSKIITRTSNDANSAQLAWLDAFSRILTHTNRLEGILDTAFKANRALDEGELRQTGIRLENMVKITANIIANVDLEQSALAEKRAADINHAVAIARAAAFAKLSTQSRLKAIVFDGSSQ